MYHQGQKTFLFSLPSSKKASLVITPKITLRSVHKYKFSYSTQIFEPGRCSNYCSLLLDTFDGNCFCKYNDADSWSKFGNCYQKVLPESRLIVGHFFCQTRASKHALELYALKSFKWEKERDMLMLIKYGNDAKKLTKLHYIWIHRRHNECWFVWTKLFFNWSFLSTSKSLLKVLLRGSCFLHQRTRIWIQTSDIFEWFWT